MPEMSLPIYLQIPSGILILFLGFYSWFRTRKKENFIFFMLAITQAVWALSAPLLFNACGNDKMVIFIDRVIVYPFSIFMPILIYHFTVEFCNAKRRWNRYLLRFGYIFSFFLLSISQSDYFINDVYYYKWGCHTKAQIGHHLYLALITVYVIFSIYILFRFLLNKKEDTLKRTQSIYILIGFFVFSLASFGLLWPYGFGVYPAFYLALPIFILIITYAITRYRLMDIRVIFRQSTVYLLSVSILLSLIFLVILSAAYVNNIEIHWSIVIYAFFAAAFLLAIFDRMKEFIRRLVNKYFFSDIINYEQAISELAKDLPKEIELEKIVNSIKKELSEILRLNDVRIVIFDKEKNRRKILVETGFADISIDYFINYLQKKRGLIVIDELNFIKNNIEDKEEKHYAIQLLGDLNNLGASICLPLFSSNNLIGVIFIGQKKSGIAYSKNDIDALLVMTGQASSAVANAILYKEVQDFNENLKQKVDEQTKDIKEKTEHLQKLLVMRSEFLNIASHQLRTPVSVIKGVLSMIMEGSVPEEKRGEFLNAAFQKSIKLNDIINDILGASELESEKFTLDLEAVALPPILQEIYKEKNAELDNDNVKIILDLPKKPLPLVLTNERYIKQVFDNLLNNAIQYTPQGSIAIKAEKKEKEVVVKITDTGIGISRDDLPKLFHKFSRAKNAVATYTDGSGLGLFIIKKIIDNHKGAEIYIESTEINKGTTFVLKLPIA